MRIAQPVAIFCTLILASCNDSSVQIIETPPPPTSLFAINGNNSVTLGWVPGAGPGGFEIHRSTEDKFSPGPETFIAQIPASDPGYIDSTVRNGERYYFRVVPYVIGPNEGIERGQPSDICIGTPLDYDSIQSIHYSDHIQPILTSGCAVSGCHTGSGPDAQFPLHSWEDIVRGGPHGALVVAYKPSKSDLVFHVNTDTLLSPVSQPHMPLPGFSLPAEQVRTLVRWINDGAPNDVGAVPFSVYTGGRILVANQAEDLVTVIDVPTNLVARYVQAGAADVSSQIPRAPHHVRADPMGRYFYVTLINGQELWKFSAAPDHAFLAKVAVSPFPADVILTPGGDTAIVTNFSNVSQIAELIDTRSMQVIKALTLPNPLRAFVSFSHGALLSHDGGRLYTTNQGSGNLIEIRLSDLSMSLVALDTTGAPTSNTQPYLSDESADGRYLFTSCYGTNEVRVVDRLRDSTRASRIIPVGIRPLHLKVSPDGAFVIVANQGSDDLTFIRISDFSTTTVSGIAHQPHGIEFSPDGKSVYVTCENRTEPVPPHHPTEGSTIPGYVTVVDYASRRVIKTIEVGSFAAGITVLR